MHYWLQCWTTWEPAWCHCLAGNSHSKGAWRPSWWRWMGMGRFSIPIENLVSGSIQKVCCYFDTEITIGVSYMVIDLKRIQRRTHSTITMCWRSEFTLNTVSAFWKGAGHHFMDCVLVSMMRRVYIMPHYGSLLVSFYIHSLLIMKPQSLLHKTDSFARAWRYCNKRGRQTGTMKKWRWILIIMETMKESWWRGSSSMSSWRNFFLHIWTRVMIRNQDIVVYRRLQVKL